MSKIILLAFAKENIKTWDEDGIFEAIRSKGRLGMGVLIVDGVGVFLTCDGQFRVSKDEWEDRT